MKITLFMRSEKVIEKLRNRPHGMGLLDESSAIQQTVPATEVLPHPKSGESTFQGSSEEARIQSLGRVHPDDIATRLHPPNVSIAENDPDEPSQISIRREVILPGEEGRKAATSLRRKHAGEDNPAL